MTNTADESQGILNVPCQIEVRALKELSSPVRRSELSSELA